MTVSNLKARKESVVKTKAKREALEKKITDAVAKDPTFAEQAKEMEETLRKLGASYSSIEEDCSHEISEYARVKASAMRDLVAADPEAKAKRAKQIENERRILELEEENRKIQSELESMAESETSEKKAKAEDASRRLSAALDEVENFKEIMKERAKELRKTAYATLANTTLAGTKEESERLSEEAKIAKEDVETLSGSLDNLLAELNPHMRELMKEYDKLSVEEKAAKKETQQKLQEYYANVLRGEGTVKITAK